MLEKKLAMLQDPKCFEENRLKAVSDHRWYETKDEAYAQEKMKLRYSLNGIWKVFPVGGGERLRFRRRWS